MGTVSVLSQQDIFVSRVLPSLFHSAPDDFIHYLTRDGNKFLRFYWEQAGKDEKTGRPSSALGLNHDIRLPFPKTTVALITLPRAAGAKTCYVAAIYRPLRRTPFLGISDTTKVISLEMLGNDPAAQETRLVEWSRRLEAEPLGEGPLPQLEAFYQAVCEIVKPS
jgi:hypothetical protein